MKRLFVLFAFLLVSCAAFAQDEKPQSEGTLLVVPRIDLDPAYSGGEWSFDLGSTSLYTLFEGNLTKNLSFSVSNHWFAFCTEWDDAASLYRNTWHSNSANWVDWANLTLTLGNFFVTAGKDYMRIATYEIDEYDYNAHWQMNSLLWNMLQVYQWSGLVGWQNDDESLKVSLQMTTDPMMVHPFESRDLKDYAYTFNTTYEGEALSLMGSVTHSGSWGWIGALGAKVPVSDALTLGTDISLTEFVKSGALSVEASVSDKLDLVGKVGYEKIGSNWGEMFGGGQFFGGAACNWYPLRDSRDLRVHLVAAPMVYVHSDDTVSSLYLSAGATYFFSFKLF